MTDLGTLVGDKTVSSAFAINASGQVVGSSDTDEYGVTHAFLYSNGTMTDLGTLAPFYECSSTAYGINASGQVVGESGTTGDTTHAFLYSSGTMTDLGTLIGGTYSSPTASMIAGRLWGIPELTVFHTPFFTATEP